MVSRLRKTAKPTRRVTKHSRFLIGQWADLTARTDGFDLGPVFPRSAALHIRVPYWKRSFAYVTARGRDSQGIPGSVLRAAPHSQALAVRFNTDAAVSAG